MKRVTFGMLLLFLSMSAVGLLIARREGQEAQVTDHVVRAGVEAPGVDALGVDRHHASARTGERHQPGETLGRPRAERGDRERRAAVEAPAEHVREDLLAAAKPPVPTLEVRVALREPALHQPRPRRSRRPAGAAAAPSSKPTRERTM